MQDELALVRDQLAQVRKQLRPLPQRLFEEAAKQAHGARNHRLLGALEAQIRPLAAEEKMVLEQEHAIRCKAQAAGEQSSQSACHAVVENCECGCLGAKYGCLGA